MQLSLLAYYTETGDKWNGINKEWALNLPLLRMLNDN
jgi:hypothetical protein